jgi:uroporphyrinogen-III synthase
MHVLITRAREDAEELAVVLSGMGIIASIDPLLDISFTPGPPLDLSAVQGLLMTSANGVRAFCERSESRYQAVYAVGDATAREARKKGFSAVYSASGDVGALADLVRRKGDPIGGDFLHCAGSKVAGDLGGVLESLGFTYRREHLYDAVKAVNLNPQTMADIELGHLDGILLYSPRTAAVFVELIRKAGLQDHICRITAYCLSENVRVQAKNLTWERMRVAASPAQDSLVSLIAKDNRI